MLGCLKRRIHSGAFMGAIHLVATWFVRIVHRVRIEGLPAQQGWADCGGSIVVANHVSGVDPVLLQVAFPRETRWMMDRTMMVPSLGFFWKFLRIIPVDTEESKTTVGAIRDAMRHLNNGGVLGIFPEGQIARPQGRILPFLPGLGILAARTGATTFVFVIDGVPECRSAFAGLFRPSRARVRLIAQVAPPARGNEVEWSGAIRTQMAQALGYPTTDTLGPT